VLSYLILLICLADRDAPLFKGDYDIPVQPLDFSNEENPATHFGGISQIESDGSRLFISNNQVPHILVVDSEGNYLGKIGEGGQGPRGLGMGPFSFSVRDGFVWASDWQRKALHLYQGESHLTRFEVPRTLQLTLATNPFAFSLETSEILFQAHPGTGFMGAVYDFDGNHLRDVGILPEFDYETKLAHPWIHQTMWVRGGNHWFALFKSLPTLVVFDAGFNVINRFHLTGPEIDYSLELFEEHLRSHPNKPGKRGFKTPPPLFTDFKYHHGKVYTMSRGTLYQIDPGDGKILSRSRFSIPEGRTTFFYLTFLDDRTIVLGHPAMPTDHDLWKGIDIPFL